MELDHVNHSRQRPSNAYGVEPDLIAGYLLLEFDSDIADYFFTQTGKRNITRSFHVQDLAVFVCVVIKQPVDLIARSGGGGRGEIGSILELLAALRTCLRTHNAD